MPDLKQQYDEKLIALISEQLNNLEKCRGYKVKRLLIERDDDWDIFHEIDSEVLSDYRGQ